MYPLLCEDLQKYNENTADNLLKEIRKYEFISNFYAYFDIIKILSDFNTAKIKI